MTGLRSLARRNTFVFAAVTTVVLLIANGIALPQFGDPSNWDNTLSIFAPFALVAMASTPSLLSGGGGLDLSIGPVANLANIFLVVYLLGTPFGSPLIAIPLVVLMGAAIGLANGFAVTVLRYSPVIATLSMFFIVGGVNLILVETPVVAPTGWTTTIGGSLGPIPWAVFLIGIPALVWFVLRRTPFYEMLLATGGSDSAAFSAGVDVTRVRILAYGLGGCYAAVAGIALTALLASANSNIGQTYTLVALAAVVLGGTPFGGGRGGLLGSILGAATIFLIQNLLSTLEVSSLWLQVVYGGMLLVGAVLGAQLARAPKLKAVE